MKLLVIGGVAGGASAAAKARRIDESAEIILFEKGEYVSFANCGLPYHVGKVITERDNLLVMTPEKLKKRANLDVRIKNEVTSINPDKKTVTVKNHETGKTYNESYDKLIMSPGSSPLRPPIPGADDPEVFVLTTIPDMDKVIKKIDSGVKNAVVIGGGFIGLEVVENLVELGIDTSLVEMLPQVLPPFDKEMSQPISETLQMHGVKLFLDNSVKAIINKQEEGFAIKLKNGETINTDLVIMSAGVKPNSELAKKAGLSLNSRGGIIVNKQLQTSNSDIYAVGDVIQINDLVLNTPAMIPLAGPANKQGRIAADNVFGKKSEYKGSLGTSVCKIFDTTAAATGINEKRLIQDKVEYKKLYITPNSNASYYPGGSMMYIKVLFNNDGKIFGSQIIGNSGVDKRIDLLATAIRNGLTFDDLEELELAYAPPYGSAKDPINFVGFVGNNILHGESVIVTADNIPDKSYLLDVRDPDEVTVATIPDSTNIPLGQLRDRLNELPKDKEIVVFCKAGLRGYLAERILRLNDFKVKNLSGGFETYKLFNPTPVVENIHPEKKNSPKAMKNSDNSSLNVKITKEIDACGLSCPGPIVKIKENIDKLKNNETLRVKVTEKGFMKDIPSWCSATGNKLIDLKMVNGIIEAIIQKGNAEVETVDSNCANTNKRTSMVMFSNDLDKALAAMIVASGFATLGHEVTIFFTFWGINILRKDNPPKMKKDLLSRMFGFMMPRGPKKLALSKMHMMGMGTKMMKNVMKSKNIDSLPELMEQARGLGVKFQVCEMAMNMMGIKEEELIDNLEIAGVANFAALAEQSNTTLFI